MVDTMMRINRKNDPKQMHNLIYADYKRLKYLDEQKDINEELKMNN